MPPAVLRQSAGQGFSLSPNWRNRTTSLFTHSDSGVCREQITMRNRDCWRADSISLFRSAEAGSSSSSRKLALCAARHAARPPVFAARGRFPGQNGAISPISGRARHPIADERIVKIPVRLSGVGHCVLPAQTIRDQRMQTTVSMRSRRRHTPRPSRASQRALGSWPPWAHFPAQSSESAGRVNNLLRPDTCRATRDIASGQRRPPGHPPRSQKCSSREKGDLGTPTDLQDYLLSCGGDFWDSK